MALPLGFEFSGPFGKYHLNIEQCLVTSQTNSFQALLKPGEVRILLVFLNNPRKVISRRNFSYREQDQDIFVTGRTLDKYVSDIKTKLRLGRENGLISVRGKGYKLEATVRPLFAGESIDVTALHQAAMFHFDQHTTRSMTLARDQSAAIGRSSPKFASAQVIKAYELINLSHTPYGKLPIKESMAEAREAADAAIDADPQFGPAYGILGLIALIYEYDWNKSEQLLARAVKLDPSDSGTLLTRAHLEISSGKPELALPSIEEAIAADPGDQIVYATRAWMHLLAGNVEQAITTGENTALSVFPQLAAAHHLLALIYDHADRPLDALRELDEALKLDMTQGSLASKGHILGQLGRIEEAQSILLELRAMVARGDIVYLAGNNEALVHVGMGDYERALSALEKAYEQRCDWLIHLTVEPRWAPLRAHTRFKQLVQNVGIPHASM